MNQVQVYVYQVGDQDCYKVGFTRKSASTRKKSLSTGSPEKLTEVRSIPTEDPTQLEKYIHTTLDHKRAPNGEFFYCDLSEIDKAIEVGLKFVNDDLKKIQEAEVYKGVMPTEIITEPSNEIFDVYSELKKAKQEQFFIEKRVEALEAIIKCAIGDNLGIEGIATWKASERKGLDSKMVEANYPEVYNECLKVSVSRRFTLLRR